MTRPTGASLIMLVLAAAFAACAEASGDVRRAEDDDIPEDTSAVEFLGCDPTEQIDAGNGTTWPDLYRDLFSASAPGNCGNPTCHGSDTGAGFRASNVACFDENGCRESFKKEFELSSESDPDKNSLVRIMRHCDDDRKRIGLMPKEPRSYFFSRHSMARVKKWIADGAN